MFNHACIVNMVHPGYINIYISWIRATPNINAKNINRFKKIRS